MTFVETPVAGAYLIELEPFRDQRGFFARTFGRREFEERGLESDFVECATSFNVKARTLRGMHFLKTPHESAKIVRCTSGALHDVIIDLRPDSGSYLKSAAFELTAENRRSLYVPRGCAHGYLTLAPSTEIFYQMSGVWSAEADAGVRWDDPAFAIAWPARPEVISARDAAFPDYTPAPRK